MSVGDHINEFRSRLIRCIIALVAFAIVAFILKDDIINIVFGPTNSDFISNKLFCRLAKLVEVDALCINQNMVTLVNTKMAGQFNLHIKMAFISSLILVVPYILYELWQFIRPALSAQVQSKSRTLVLQISLWFFTGLFFGYFIVAPLAVNFLTNYEVSDQITNMIEVSSYLSSVMGVSLACGLTFQLPLLVKLLASIGLINSVMMKTYRRFAFIIILIISSIITPPDVFSQILVAVPLYFLYEYGITITKKIEKNRAETENE